MPESYIIIITIGIDTRYHDYYDLLYCCVLVVVVATAPYMPSRNDFFSPSFEPVTYVYRNKCYNVKRFFFPTNTKRIVRIVRNTLINNITKNIVGVIYDFLCIYTTRIYIYIKVLYSSILFVCGFFFFFHNFSSRKLRDNNKR